jgi:Ser/Thr protein kinase RdoA (MazF antagonist)
VTVDRALAESLAARFGLDVVRVELLDVAVNDVACVDAASGRFALKIYHPGRTPAQVAWEVDLLLHLGARGAPVALPVPGPKGHVVTVADGRVRRSAVLFAWAGGTKPAPSVGTYRRLGEAAARIHEASAGFPASPAREEYGTALLVDDQLRRMRTLLSEAGQWERTLALGERLKDRLADPGLDHGICHVDLTLDNVLDDGGTLTVFDFDSAGPSWRAIEPSGVLRYSTEAFRSWLTGYRSVRAFRAADEAAVAVLAVVADFRNVTWKLGLAVSSHAPLLRVDDLPEVVDDWLAWEREHPG